MVKFCSQVADDPISENSFIKLLEAKDIFAENESSKIFRQKEGSDIITLTPYALYMMAAQAKADFSRYILELDKDLIYHSEQEDEIVDPEAIKEIKLSLSQNTENYNLAYKEKREEHLEWFEEKPAVENIAPYIANFIHNKTYKPSDLEAVVDAYKISNLLSKNSSDDLPKIMKKSIKSEFSDEWKAITAKIKDDTGYKTDAEIKQMALEKGAIKKTIKTRLKMNRQPGQNTSQLKLYTEDFLNILFEDEIENIKLRY